jgi:hypothetical protein
MNDSIIKKEFVSFPEDQEAFNLYKAYESGDNKKVADALQKLYYTQMSNYDLALIKTWGKHNGNA